MRYLLILLSFYFPILAYGQVCSCNEAPCLQEVISCEKVIFTNHSKLYRQYSCDSSWLTFESRYGEKRVLYSLAPPLLELSERLGYQYIQENKSSFLIMNRLISGCCTPPEYLLFSKDTGKLLKDLGRLIYYSEDTEENFVLYFSDTTLNSLTLLYLNSGKSYNMRLPKNRFHSTLEKSGENYGELLFDEGNLKGSLFTISYRYQIRDKTQTWYNERIEINLNNYTP